MFRTELPLTPHSQQLPLSARVLTIGSCFSDSIGSRLADFKVATMANPFGTVFNPISACKLLRAAAGEDMDWQQHLVEARGRWQSYDLHAEVGASSPVELLQHIQALTRETGVFLATADLVVLTLGTAYAYRLRETDEIVNNCHKVPAEKFEKELLTADEIIAAVAETHAYLRRINPRLRFVLTVSPVRHVKETLVLNSASKAMLRVACHYLSELLPDVSYFPAYELLVDDLRDYRFYASDMLHPSEVAENYIWERFTRTYFDTAFGRFKKEWEGIRQALGHRPLYAASPEHRQFLESTLERLQKVSGLADVRMETLHLERELAGLPLPPAPVELEEEEYDDGEERIDVGGPSVVEVSTSGRQEASLDGAGAGILLETDDEDEEEEDEEVSSEAAYEHAYTATNADDEEEADAAPDSDEATAEGEEPVRKKKRRSRGGAKRTKRKHARLAAELGAEATATQPVTASIPAAVSDPDTQPDETQDEAEPTTPADEVIYITEDELRRGRRSPAEVTPSTQPSTDAPEPAGEEEASTPETPASTQPRRERNNRRAPRPARSGGRTERPALYAAATTEDPADEPTPAPAASVTTDAPVAPASSETEVPILETAPVAAVVEPSNPGTRTRKRPPAKPRATPATAPDAATPAEAVAAPTPEPAPPVLATSDAATATPDAAPKPAKAPARSRKRPAAKASATSAPEAAPKIVPEAAPVPAAEVVPATAKPARKRPPRRPKAAAEAAVPAPAEAVAPAPAEAAPAAAAPKRKPRPPRRKPSADTPITETT